jgi:hypothetical protein
MNEYEKLELAIRQSLASLRHLYENMMNGNVRGQVGIQRIATRLLSPEIQKLEKLADSLVVKK